MNYHCILKKGISFLYPERCAVCGNIVCDNLYENVCLNCKNIFQLVREPRCKKCSKPILNPELEFCLDCDRKEAYFDKGFALWVYDKYTKKSIADFKYGKRKEYLNYYVQESVNQYKKEFSKLAIDAIIPVPLHPLKQHDRGFNQAGLIAKGIAKHLETSIIEDVLLRKRKTMPQKELNNKERMKNLLEAFYVDKLAWKRYHRIRNIMLVDDIYTTGSTINACAKALYVLPIKKVYFFALCIGRGF